METIAAIVNSEAFKWGNVIFNWIMLYVFYRLGRNRGRIDQMPLLSRQMILLETLHHQLELSRAHADNLAARLAEARSAK